LGGVSDPAAEETYEVSCPHCKKPFTGRLLSGTAARYHGFKCPHCKLFVPFARVNEERELAEHAE
jgi:hypothetical protein